MLCSICGIRAQASSYNYDKHNDIISAPSAYFVAQFLDLKQILPPSFNDKKIKAIELTSISDQFDNIQELVLLAHLFESGSNKAQGIIILLTPDYQYKTHLITTSECIIPLAPTSICYTNGFLYVGGSEEYEKFITPLYNPLTNELIANVNALVTPRIKEQYNIIYEQLMALNMEKAALFKRDYLNAIKPQAFIYQYARQVNNTFLPLTKPLHFIKTIGLNSKEMAILKTPFRPLKITANAHMETFYVISADSEMGILVFRLDGTFVKFIGLNKIELSLKEKLWRKLVDQEVLDAEARKTQLNFTAMALDNSGFLYTVTSAAKNTPVQRFNQAGKNILVEDSYKKIQGDYPQSGFTKNNNIVAKFSLISVSNYKTYLLYDSNNNKLFTYNNNGELMYLYGSRGHNIEQLNNVRDIKIVNQTYLVLENDNYANYLKVLKPTKYGRLINQSAINYAQGNYEQSLVIYQTLLQLNSNCEYAYNGLGKIAFLHDDYKAACNYFKLASNKLGYLEAYEKYRNLQIEEGLLLGLSIIFLGMVFTISKKIIFPQ